MEYITKDNFRLLARSWNRYYKKPKHRAFLLKNFWIR